MSRALKTAVPARRDCLSYHLGVRAGLIKQDDAASVVEKGQIRRALRAAQETSTARHRRTTCRYWKVVSDRTFHFLPLAKERYIRLERPRL